MDTLVTFIHFEIWFLLIGLLLLVVYQILTGKIELKGILIEKDCSGKTVKGYSQVRVQLLIFTVIGACYYLQQVVNNPNEFPKVSEELLLLMGGSNMTYLGGKYYSLLFKRKKG